MFKVGDKVRIIHNNVGRKAGCGFGMNKLVGSITTVGRIEDVGINRGNLYLDNDPQWSWDPLSVELVDEFHVGDVIRSKRYGHEMRIIKENGDKTFHVENNVGKYGNIPLSHVNWHIIKKYPLRDAKGHFIKCDRIVNPPEKKPAKPRKAKAKAVVYLDLDGFKEVVAYRAHEVAKAAIIAPVEAAKPLPEAPKKPAFDLREALARKCGKGMANYALEFSKDAPRFQIDDACHARMCWQGYKDDGEKDKQIVNIAMSIKQSLSHQTDAFKPWYKEYVHYVLNDSPWKPCFLTHDTEEALEKGILFNVDDNISHLVGAAIVLREGHEYSSKLKTFHDVLAKGYSGNVAYLVSFFITNGMFFDDPTGHKAFHPDMKVQEIKDFFTLGYRTGQKAARTDRGEYAIFSSIQRQEKYVNHYGYGVNPAGNDKLKTFAKNHIKMVVKGEGFAQRSFLDYEASIVMLADGFKKLLEN